MIFKRLVSAALITTFFLNPLQSLAQNQPHPDFQSESPRSFDAQYQKLIADLDETLQGHQSAHPLDVFRVLDQETHAVKKTKVTPEQIHLKIKGRLDSESARIDRYLFKPSTQSNFHETQLPTWSSQNPAKVEIWLRSQKLVTLGIDVQTITFWGDYLVFTERGGYIPSTQIQNLLFIDLKTFGRDLGKHASPIFRLPIKMGSELARLNIQGGKLVLGAHSIPISFLNEYNQLNQLAFNVLVNLTDPNFYADVSDDLSETIEIFKEAAFRSHQAMESMVAQELDAPKLYLNYADSWLKRFSSIEDFQKLSLPEAEQETAHESIVQDAKRGRQSFDALKKSADAIKHQRRLISRISRVFGRISLPRPAGGTQIRMALATVAGGLLHRAQGNPRAMPMVKEGVLRILNHPYIRRGALPVAAAISAAYFPEETSMFVLNSLDHFRQFSEFAFGSMRDIAQVGQSTAQQMTTSLNPQVLYDTYVANGSAEKTIHGMKAISQYVLTRIVGIHVTINTFYLIHDLAKNRFENFSFSGFIRRQENAKAQYLEIQSKALGGDNYESTAEKEALIDEAFQELKKENGFTRLYSRLKDSAGFIEFRRLLSRFGDLGPVRFAKAMGNFLFSLSSFTNTFQACTALWNYVVYPVRSFIFNPVTLLPAYLSHPEFFYKATQNPEGMILPTRWNGGTRNLLQSTAALFKNKEFRTKLSQFEDQISEAEALIKDAALKRAFTATLAQVKKSGDMQALIQAGGIQAFDDPVLSSLPRKIKLFHRHYFNALFEEALHEHIQSLTHQLNHEMTGVSVDDPKALKEAFVHSEVDPRITSTQAESLVESVHSAKMELILAKAKKAQSLIVDPKAFLTNTKYSMLQKINPKKSRVMNRMVITHRALKDPLLMQRAVIKQISGMIIDVPMELVLMMVLFAGATSVELQPIQDLMHSNTSWNYLSAAVFKGWLVAFTVSFLSNTWSDLQMLYRQNGEFGLVPDKNEKSMLKWFYRNGWKNRENGLMDNWKEANEIMIANMKSYLSLGIVTSMFIYNRFDIDLYLTWYILGFGLPVNALSYKLENAFEHASDYYFKDFPEEVRNSPRVLEYVNGKKQKSRLIFNFWYRLLWENPAHYFLDFIQMTNVGAIGPRSFARTLFGGLTPTIWYSKAAEATKALFAFIPGSGELIDSCNAILTNGYPAWGDQAPVGPAIKAVPK